MKVICSSRCALFVLILFTFLSANAQKFDVGLSIGYGNSINKVSDMFSFKKVEKDSLDFLSEFDLSAQLNYGLFDNDKLWLWAGSGFKFLQMNGAEKKPLFVNVFVGGKYYIKLGRINVLTGAEIGKMLNTSSGAGLESNYFNYKIFAGLDLGIVSKKMKGLYFSYGYHQFSNNKFLYAQTTIPLIRFIN